ncbi:hypothetical protein NMY22_g14381 [Coprinellus aureogranulatus]|nr:hypothetical protein NMY22_g14381 [Coprinellus aureogranulatus]
MAGDASNSNTGYNSGTISQVNHNFTNNADIQFGATDSAVRAQAVKPEVGSTSPLFRPTMPDKLETNGTHE